MGKTVDPIVSYLQELDIRPVKSFSKLKATLEEAAGKEWTQDVLDFMNHRYDGKSIDPEGDKKFYDLKNSNSAGSIALTGAIDGDIIRQFCVWISDHQECFGDSILEVGCDIGILSCYLAKLFPNSTILSVDRCESSIKTAQAIAEKFGLKNITFKVCDVNDIEGKFDTVFSARTMHENFYIKGIDALSSISKQGELYKEALMTYASKLASLVSSEGALVSIERVKRDTVLYGWMLALNEQCFVQDIECYKNLACQELRGDLETSHFQAMTFVPGEKLSEDLVYKAFRYTFIEDIDLKAAAFTDWEAAIVFENTDKHLIEGYEVYNPKMNNWKFAQYSLWTVDADAEGLLVYIQRDDEKRSILENHYLSDKEDTQLALRNLIKCHLSEKYIIKKWNMKTGSVYREKK